MDPSRSFEKYLPSPIKYVFPWPGAFTMSFTRHSYLPIAKRTHTDPTILGHLLTLSKEKKNMR